MRRSPCNQGLSNLMQLFTYLAPTGQALLPYLSEISIALVACTLVMLGGEINAFLRRALRNQHFLVRTLAFIFINAFGYGLIIVKASPYVARTLAQLESGMMLTLIVSCFVVIGLWAQRNHQI
ncbi:DUF3392 domain-containing protein [Vibrio cholerae]|nr:DUF3392 domain-containing protein [Vibrio cholerae]MRI17293.1 DUF3392 domain-containing protein [Vibrio cholerae]MRI21242.1 DUF3392 domain-containing protein [Vibrio cholerae]MRI24799.1 DUF3392 domain-containing protein [Vibrio cholerae]MRI27815.1 DUF3392 domain-containing protein [Vibrio cholerae]